MAHYRGRVHRRGAAACRGYHDSQSYAVSTIPLLVYLLIAICTNSCAYSSICCHLSVCNCHHGLTVAQSQKLESLQKRALESSIPLYMICHMILHVHTLG